MIGTSAKINATADADWAADVDGRRSRAGFIIYCLIMRNVALEASIHCCTELNLS